MSLNKARILSSENDASVKQEQNTEVKINIVPRSVENSPLKPDQDINFTLPMQTQFAQQNVLQKDCVMDFQSQSQHETSNQEQDSKNDDHFNQIQLRNISELLNQSNIVCADLEAKNKFLSLLISIYEENPLRINNCLICKSSSLMNLIKILTSADKVELVINDEQGCTGCISNKKYMTIDRILVYKDNKSLDLKYAFNDTYTTLIRHSISVKYCI